MMFQRKTNKVTSMRMQKKFDKVMNSFNKQIKGLLAIKKGIEEENRFFEKQEREAAIMRLAHEGLGNRVDASIKQLESIVGKVE